MREKLTSFEVSKGLNIPYGRLREWIVRKHIEPSVQAKGQGSKAHFSRLDVYLIKLFESLLNCGISRGKAAKCVAAKIVNDTRTIAQISPEDFNNCVYVVLYRQSDENYLTAFIPYNEFQMSLSGTTVDGKRAMFDDAIVVNFSNIRNAVDHLFN